MELASLFGARNKKDLPTPKSGPSKAPVKLEPLETAVVIETPVYEDTSKHKFDLLPMRVDKFDELLEDHGVERGATLLLSGGAGTGKTTFCMQSLYYGALNGEKSLYISFEEDPRSIKYHMKKNFGWDFDKLEELGLFSIVHLDPGMVARQVEEWLAKEKGILRIPVKDMEFPLVPDRVCVDSLSALSIEFENDKDYRKYITQLFHLFHKYNSINLVISETEQAPSVYSRSGVEEFLVDGVIVFYNFKIGGKRSNALEILKLRSGKHLKETIPYRTGQNGFEIFTKQRIEFE